MDQQPSASEAAYIVRGTDWAAEQIEGLLWFYATAPLDLASGVKSAAQAARYGDAMRQVGRVAGSDDSLRGAVFVVGGRGQRAGSESSALGRAAHVVEQGRDATGRFVTKLGGELRPGTLAEQAVGAAIRNKPGWSVLGEQVYVRDLTTGKIRILDYVVRSPGNRIVGIEVKGGGATLGPAQRVFDEALTRSQGVGFEAFGQVASGIDELVEKPSAIQRIITIEHP
jgi:hypothetical protein